MLLSCYTWLADTIHAARRISREELDYRWSLSSLNERHEHRIPDDVLREWIEGVRTMLGVQIVRDLQTGAYTIENEGAYSENTMQHWLLNALAVADLARDEQLRGRVLLEDMPSGARCLLPVLDAIRRGHALRITYQGFDAEPHDFEFEPYCLKAFKQRWYAVGRSSDHPDDVRVYALDRMLEVAPLPRLYTIPADFDAADFFRYAYGVWVGEQKPERVVVQVSVHEAYYLRSLPLHHSQREIEYVPDTTFNSGDGYAVYEYWLVPTYDFMQELQTHGAQLQVLEPRWLASKFRQLGEAYCRMYPPQP